MVKGCGYCSVVLLSILISMMFAGMFAGAIPEANSQEKYPTRAIDIVCPFSPGGGTDLMNRVMAPYLSRRWGVPVNMVNKPGGNTVPACLEVYGARPDGYTILADGTPSAGMLPVVVKNLTFKISDRTFIASVSIVPFVLSVPAASPFKTLKELVDEAKKDPESFTWTSLGGASLHDYTIRQFLKDIGVDVLKTKPIMSQGGSQAVVLTAGNNVKLGGGTTSSCLPAIRAGTIRALAVTSKDRWIDLPDVPTTAEAGYPGVNAVQWNGPSGPGHLPPAVVDVWDRALQGFVKDPETISRFRNIGALPFYLNAREVRDYALKETEEIIKLWSGK
jgi:tripartite-type tricarboxylate transporter receptor subunit TctC